MKTKKGFTLVELLAVLLVMAILALIAVPMVVNVINKARKQAYQRSIEGFVRATELSINEWQMDHPNGTAPTTLSSYTGEYAIEVKGDQVECDDEFYRDEKGHIYLFGCQTSKSKQKYPELKFKYEAGKASEAEYKEYAVGDSFIFGNTKYYVISPSGKSQDYVVGMKEDVFLLEEIQNLNVNVNYTNDSAPKLEMGLYGYDNSDVKIVIDAWSNTLPTGLKEVGGYKARLIKYNEIIDNFKYSIKNEGASNEYIKLNSSVPTWIYETTDNFEYWTMTPADDSRYYVVSYNRDITRAADRFDLAVRPVINVYKSAIDK